MLAELDGQVVGHVVCSGARIEGHASPGWSAHFQLRRLTAWRSVRGRFRYAPAFDRL